MTKTPPPAGKGQGGPSPSSPKGTASGALGEADGKVEGGLPNHGPKGR